MTGLPPLLAVFAHPDDESLACGALLASCATLGVRVSLLCLTHGEHGQRGPTPGPRRRQPRPERPHPASRTRSLRRIRAAELRAAAQVLGIVRVRLLSHEDGMLPWIATAQLEADIRDEIQRTAPGVVVTFDADGLYWHPDHIAVYERTSAAVAALPGPPPALFHAAMPPGAMRAVVDHAARVSAARGLPRPYAGSILGVPDPDAFGAAAPPPDLVLHAPAHAAQKLRALRCHRTQFDDSALRFIDNHEAPRLLGTEHYRRSAVGSRDATIVDHLAATPPTIPG